VAAAICIGCSSGGSSRPSWKHLKGRSAAARRRLGEVAPGPHAQHLGDHGIAPDGQTLRVVGDQHADRDRLEHRLQLRHLPRQVSVEPLDDRPCLLLAGDVTQDEPVAREEHGDDEEGVHQEIPQPLGGGGVGRRDSDEQESEFLGIHPVKQVVETRDERVRAIRRRSRGVGPCGPHACSHPPAQVIGLGLNL